MFSVLKSFHALFFFFFAVNGLFSLLLWSNPNVFIDIQVTFSRTNRCLPFLGFDMLWYIHVAHILHPGRKWTRISQRLTGVVFFFVPTCNMQIRCLYNKVLHSKWKNKTASKETSVKKSQSTWSSHITFSRLLPHSKRIISLQSRLWLRAKL